MRVVLRRDDDVGRVHPLGEIPQPLAPDASGDRNLPAHHQELQHLGDVAVVRPPGRDPRHHARVRDVARAQRPGAAEQFEDVAPEAVVVADPRVRALVNTARPAGREVQAEVAHRPHQRVVLEQRAVLLQGLPEVVRPVRRAEAAPGDEVRAGGDRRSRVDLEQGQLPDDGEQIGRPGASSSCARTAMRRACALVSRCTDGRPPSSRPTARSTPTADAVPPSATTPAAWPDALNRYLPSMRPRAQRPVSQTTAMPRSRPGSGRTLASASIASRVPRERRVHASIRTVCCARLQVPRISPSTRSAPGHTRGVQRRSR